MNRRSIISAVALAVAAVSLSPVSGAFAQDAAISGSTLVLYTSNEEGMLDSLIPVFERNTGVTVQLITAGGTGELYQRVHSEAGNPQGDVMFGGSRSSSRSRWPIS